MQIESKSAESLVLEIEKLLSQGGYQEAVKLCQAINEHHPNLGHGWFLSSCVAYQLNIMPFALHSVNQALSLSIDNPNLKIQKAKCLVKMGDMAQALEIIDNLVKHKMLNAELFNDIALIYNDCHQLNKACEIFKMAIELSPESSNYYYNLASVERYLGLIESCESNCNLAIKNDLFNFDAHYLRSNLKKQSLESNHTEQLNKVLETEIGHPVNYAKIKYALAKELEDCGKFRKSFEARQEGASAYRKLFNYNVKADVEFMQNIALTYNQDVFKKEIQGDLGAGLIFILGLPRTGSTLVERIMSNHSAISSMGELSAFSNIMSEMVSHLASTKAASVSDMVNLSSQLNFQKLGQSYMDYISRIKIDSKYHIDKFPQNSLYIGLIHLALPQAKIILVERDPMDSCYSIYKELFTNIYHYSYDLTELAEYYIAHSQLMNHWKKVLPEVVKTVKYEDLVYNIENESRKLLVSCNIEWQPQCVDFTENKQISMTASASQVRQKLYTTSVGKWKNYKDQLSELSKKIEDCLNH